MIDKIRAIRSLTVGLSALLSLDKHQRIVCILIVLHLDEHFCRSIIHDKFDVEHFAFKLSIAKFI